MNNKLLTEAEAKILINQYIYFFDAVTERGNCIKEYDNVKEELIYRLTHTIPSEAPIE